MKKTTKKTADILTINTGSTRNWTEIAFWKSNGKLDISIGGDGSNNTEYFQLDEEDIKALKKFLK